MIDLIFNAVKVAFSKDVRDGVTSIIDLVRKMPQWKEQVCTLQAAVARRDKEQCEFLCELATMKMTSLHYHETALAAYRTSFSEAVSNAYEHSATKDKDEVALTLEINQTFASFIVRNPKGRRFDLSRQLERGKRAFQSNPAALRGRGLLLIEELSDDFSSLDEAGGVKAIFYRKRVKCSVSRAEDITVVNIQDGLYNSSFERRLLNLVTNLGSTHLLLDFTGWSVFGSLVCRMTLRSEALLSLQQRRVVALLAPDDGGSESPVVLPVSLVANSAREALDRLGLPELEAKVRAILEQNVVDRETWSQHQNATAEN